MQRDLGVARYLVTASFFSTSPLEAFFSTVHLMVTSYFIWGTFADAMLVLASNL